MTKLGKRVLTVFLVIAMIIALMPQFKGGTVYAGDSLPGGTYKASEWPTSAENVQLNGHTIIIMDRDLHLGTLDVVSGNLTIRGKGTLTLDGYRTLIKAGELYVEGATIKAYQNDTDMYEGIVFAINTKVGSKIEFKNADITIVDKGNADVLAANGVLKIEDSKVDITGNRMGMDAGGSITINRSNVKIRSKGASIHSRDIVNITESTVDIKSTESMGIKSTRSNGLGVSVDKSTLKIEAGHRGINANGVWMINSKIQIASGHEGIDVSADDYFGEILVRTSDITVSGNPAMVTRGKKEGLDSDSIIVTPKKYKLGIYDPYMCAVLNSDGSLANKVVIKAWSLEDTSCNDIPDQTYTGKAIEPAVKVIHGTKTLKKGTEYTVSFKNNVKAGTATVTITGVGFYTGTRNVTFKIRPKSIANASISGISNKTYTGKAITQNPTVEVGSTTLKSGTDYTVSYKNNVNAGTATVTITGKGNYTGSISKTFKINTAVTSIKAKSITVGSVGNKTWTGSLIKPKVTVKNGSTTLKEGTDYTLSYKNNTAVGTATITITGKGKYKDTRTVSFKIVAPAKQIERVEGRNRYLTSIAIADELKASNGNKKFPAIIVATGAAHPDALAGGYLAKVKNAPIILTAPSIESDTIKYIKSNMAANGKVYILGGELAIPNSFVTKLRSAGITNYKRLGGKSRFDTNLLILNEAGVKKGQELVVAKGYGSGQTDAQDALIAASTGRPMLLVSQGDLTPSQKNFLNNKRPKTMTIIGSTAMVSSKIVGQLSSYGTTSRIAGDNIYDRSVKVGEKYYKAPKCVIITTGLNWPDALTGGPLAVKKDGPLLLVGSSYNQYKYAKAYVKRTNIYKNYTLGGINAVPETTTKEIMKR